MSTTSHLVGPAVIFNREDRCIQRCAVCGEKLQDLQPTKHPGFLTYLPLAHLVRVHGNEFGPVEDLGGWDEVADMPEDFCLELVEGP